MNQNDTTTSIEKLRSEVDVVDFQILQLVKKRAALARQMGIIKKKAGAPLRDTTRESEILIRVAHENKCSEPQLSETDLRNLYLSLMRVCLNIQESDQTHLSGCNHSGCS